MNFKKIDNVKLFRWMSYMWVITLFVEVLFGWLAETSEERIVWAIAGLFSLGFATLLIALSLISKALKEQKLGP